MDKYARFKYQPCIPLGKDGKRVTASKEHLDISRQAACDGIVMLKNTGEALPLKHGEKIALFGKATIEYIKGGGGSGDVLCPYIHNIYDGFAEKEKEGKVSIYMPLIDFYKEYVKVESKKIPTPAQIDATWNIVNNMEFCQKRDDMTYDTFYSMHVTEAAVPDDLIKDAADNAETAVITISRFSAEGTDRRAVGGDYYLSQVEKDLIDKCTSLFGKVIVIYNTGAVTDCEYVAENDKVQGILFGWQAGMEGGMALSDVICGDVNPSGKLPDTIATTYDIYPSKEDMIESFDFANYSEDIYVGYRFFETIPGKKEYVRYPFGFGLSYTTFRFDGVVAGENDGKITVAVNVTNTGSVPGKEVVQVYYSAPQGKLGKPSVELAEFCKTKLLEPGETQTVALSFDVSSMASFDDMGKVCKSAYVLEKGTYSIFVGNSSRNLRKVDFEYITDSDIVCQQLRQYCKPTKLACRMIADGTFEKLPSEEENFIYEAPAVTPYSYSNTTVPFEKVGEEISLDDFVNQFTLEEMMDFVGGHAPTGVANTGCFGGLKRLNVPAVPTADGPAGLRLEPATGISTTAFPCATLLAATWDKDLCRSVGEAAASEIRENNIGVWLAPAVNIHRNPLCGRNFEYFSEDPVLAGKCCAAEIRGIQSQKVAVSLKHFAGNNKEPNRYASDSRMSERALREIYLKNFEIAVKEGDPWTVMSSYNLINGKHTSESWELLTGILRNEWGFRGMVVTDWGVKNDPVVEVTAGNDMKMHCGYPEDLKAGLTAGRLSPDHLKICVMRILDMFTKVS